MTLLFATRKTSSSPSSALTDATPTIGCVSSLSAMRACRFTPVSSRKPGSRAGSRDSTKYSAISPLSSSSMVRIVSARVSPAVPAKSSVDVSAT